MLNVIFVFIVVASVLMAAWSGQMEALTQATLTKAKDAVTLALGLVGVMAFFLGLMRVAEDAGLLRTLARRIGPLLHKLFPAVPPDHPAMSAMILNISSNMLGLANAATPFGIKAMEELDKLNSRKGTATNAMCLFLAINTAGLAVLPTGVVGLRASMGSEDAMGILFSTWFASGAATVVGVTAAALLSRLPAYRSSQPPPVQPADLAADDEESAAGIDELAREETPVSAPAWRRWGVRLFWLVFLVFLSLEIVRRSGEGRLGVTLQDIASYWALPALIVGLVLFGWSRGVRVYDSLVEGAKEGFQVALRIIPYLVAILVAVGMFRAAGGIDLIVRFLSPVTGLIGMPAEALPMALLRPLTGSGAYGVMAEIMSEHGPDSFIGYMVSTFQGSTETTFYVLAVYFGAVGIRKTRHALPACLRADVAGILAAVLIINLIHG
jgi:spore maturation protein SpmA